MAKQKKKPSAKAPQKAEAAPKRAVAPWIWFAQALVIIAAGLWIYWPAMNGGWLWDDDIYVTDNHLLRSLSGLQRIWLDPAASHDYYPLDNTAWWIEWQLWGMQSTGYHMVNVALHLIGALLVWRLLAKFGLRFAWLGGLLFAIHPLQVESVAWVAELKNTLSLPFFLLAMICWIDFEDGRRRRDYLLSLAFFTIAMLGKPTMLTFPAVILLYAWWKRSRIDRRDIVASLPFFAVALIFGVVTVAVTQHLQPNIGTVPINAPDNPLTQVIAAGCIVPFVLWYVFVPLGLVSVYPPIQIDLAEPLEYLSWPLLAAVFFYFWSKRKTWGRDALLGLGFFLLMLAPVLGFVATNYRTMTWSMDHLDYLPMIGIAALAVMVLGAIAQQIPTSLRLPGAVFVGVIMAALAWESHGYAGLYADQEVLLTYTLKNNPLAWPANYNLGLVMLNSDRVDQAIAQFQQALKLEPGYPAAHDSLGNAFLRENRLDEAREQYQEALDLRPKYAKAHYNMGDLLKKMGHLDEAAAQYEEAVKLNPDLYQARYNWGNVLLSTGHPAEAIEQYRAALEIAPDNIEARENLAGALLKSGRTKEAIDTFRAALSYNPDDDGIHYGLANALFVDGQTAEAINEFWAALKINPQFAPAHYNLGYAFMQSGQKEAAIEQFQETLRINPDDAGAKENLEKLQGAK
jgi:tetratricopeptide (TPR) repeat protein